MVKQSTRKNYVKQKFENAADPTETTTLMLRKPSYLVPYKFTNKIIHKNTDRYCEICHEMKPKTTFYRHKCELHFTDKRSYEQYIRKDRDGLSKENRNDGNIESWCGDLPGMKNGVSKGNQCK